MSETHPEIGEGPATKSAADQGRQLARVRDARCIQTELIRPMTPARRLQVARGIYETAWLIKETGLRRQYPDWTDEAIRAKCRRVFVTGYAGA
jgi:hypothetical protein